MPAVVTRKLKVCPAVIAPLMAPESEKTAPLFKVRLVTAREEVSSKNATTGCVEHPVTAPAER
jgi:hypothetical protein